MAKTKLSFDITDENKACLELIKNQTKDPYGVTINHLIELFCNLPEHIKKELVDLIKPKLCDLYEQMDSAGKFESASIISDCQIYIDLSTFFNDGKYISIDELKKEPRMKKIPMEDGYLVCPADFYILNPEKAKESRYATAIEVTNTTLKAPHFIYFAGYPTANYTDMDIDIINNLCVNAWPQFEDVLHHLVEPVRDPDNRYRYLNEEAVNAAPKIGYFGVYVHGDPDYPKNYKPPMGTRIVRTGNYD